MSLVNLYFSNVKLANSITILRQLPFQNELYELL